MKFPLFSKKDGSTLPAGRDSQAELEKLMAHSLRVLGALFGKMADVIEQSRLARDGYKEQDRFLKRVDPPEGKKS